jgi:carbon monoxide dehydrogenase subunit G
VKLEGEQLIARDRAAVWAALNDPEVLASCIPGCQSMEKSGDNAFEAVVKQKVGPVSATFKGAVELTDLNPPESYKISGEGKGGAAGFAKGSADVRLEEAEGGTKLIYNVDAKVGGKLAQLGGRLIDGFAKKSADQFFEKFKAEVEGDTAGDEAETPLEAAADTVTEAVEDIREAAADAVETVKEEIADLKEDAAEAREDINKKGVMGWLKGLFR